MQTINTSRWDTGLNWHDIPQHIVSPTDDSEKLWQTVARLGNNFYAELYKPGMALVPAGGTVSEAIALQTYANNNGLNIGHYFDTAITQALHDRAKVESPESFMLDELFGEPVVNPDDQNPAFGVAGMQQDPEGTPEDAGIDSSVIRAALPAV